MAEVNFNVIPYNDDFDPDKLFYKILFRPSYAVQARELTQIQSIIQNQIRSMGEHIFKDGSMVIPGTLTINKEYEYVRLQSYSTSSITDLIGTNVTSSVSGIQALIINGVEAEDADPATLFVRYENQSNNLDSNNLYVKRFEPNEVLSGTTSAGVAITCQVEEKDLNEFIPVANQGSSVHIEEGVYFINGYFVKNSEQTVILDKYFNFPSYRVGFQIQQSFINSFTESSLNDNATGTSNLNAPGADRFSISITLVKKNINDFDDTDFVQIVQVENGVQENIINKVEYNVLEETLARRTYDESGNYVVKNFDIDIREHKNDGTNRGIYRPDSDLKYEIIYTEAQSDALLAVGLSPGKAYVEGYEHRTLNQKFTTISKAREVDTVQNSFIRLNLDNSINVTNSYSIPDLGSVTGQTEAYKELILYKSATTQRGSANTGTVNSLNEIGRAKPRFYEYQTGGIGGTGLFGSNPISATTNGDGTAGPYTLNTSLTNGSTATVKLDNVLQTENVDYTISGTSLTFLTSTPSSSNVIEAKQHTDVYKLGLFDIKFFTHLVVGIPSLSSEPGYSYALNIGKTLTGQSSGATGIIEENSSADTSGGIFLLSNVSGTFQQSEDVIDNDGNIFGVSSISQYSVKDIRQFYMEGNVPYSSDAVLNSAGDAILSGTEFTCPVYKLPQNVIKTLKTEINENQADSSHKVRRMFVGEVNTNGTISFNAETNETFDSYLSGDYALSIMSSGNGPTSDIQGDIIDLTNKITIAGTPFGRQITIDFGSTDFSGAVVKFSATISRSVTEEKTKQLITNQTVSISSVSDDDAFEKARASVISLGKADVYRLNSVYMSSDFSTPATTSDTNITDRFTLDDGQRESFYDIGRIIRNPGESIPTGRLLINFDYFDHGNGDYFTVDSYNGVVDYEQIPTFNSTTKGKLFLRDCIDFRPRVSDSSNVIGYDGDASNAKSYLSSGSTVDIPKPGSDFLCDFEFYLARIDAIGMNTQGQFKVSRGEAALDPQKPDKLDNVMLLYYLYLPAYTFNISDIRITPIDNRRFTMRDIGKLEQRIRNVEYYTQLSLLEQSAINTQIPDSSGLDRFKNGILVDPFKGHNIGDVSSIDYQCSIDMKESELRPPFSQQLIELQEVNTSDTARTNAGYKKTGDLITLPYSDLAFTGNPYASKWVNCNPYVVFQYVGEVSLTPSVDEWRDVDRKPNLIVNNNFLFNTFSDFAVGNSLGTVWNDWQSTWSGEPVSNNFSGDIDVQTNFTRTTETLTRTGTTRELGGSTTARDEFGDRVIDTSFIAFIRARTINFRGTRLKPNTRVYPFFDEVDVSAYCTPTGGSLGGNLITNDAGEVTGTFAIPNTDTVRFRTGDRVFKLTSSAINAQSSAVTDDEVSTFGEGTYTARGLLTTNEQTIQSTRVPIIDKGTDTETDTRVTIDNISVNASATNILQSISNLQDVTEENRDSINLNASNIVNLNNTVEQNNETIRQNKLAIEANAGDISAVEGQMDSVQRKNRALDISVSRLRGQVNRLNASVFPPRRTDPVAQTFFINETGGCFVTKVDLYFKSKDNKVPIRVYLTSTLGGRPTENIIAFSDMVLNPEDILVSDDATAITTVTFSSPVYLQTNKEYALVLRPNSQEYEVWVSRLGQNNLGTTERITRQPLLGSFFRSQNAALWTEDQYEDLTFFMYRADFTTNTFGNVDLKNIEIPVDELSVNSILTNATAGTGTLFGDNPSILRVYHKNHGMNSGAPSKVTIAGFTDSQTYNGILGSAINGTHDINNVSIDSYTITLSGATATGTGAIGGSGITATQEINFQVLQPQIGELVFDNTKVNQSIKTTSARSPQGSETPYVFDSKFRSIVPNDNYYFTSNRSVLSTINEQTHLNGSNSLLYRISLISFNSNISPAIDLQRVNLFAINNRLNAPIANVADIYDQFINETEGQGGSAAAKYITKEIILENPSTAIDLRLSASIFSSSSIEVYHKTRGSEDSRLLSEIPFVRFDTVNTPANSEDRSQSPYNVNYKKDFSEYKFSAEGLLEFTSFQIKIVMKGNNPAYPPRITDLRAIALAI